jgi:hypothetical protein
MRNGPRGIRIISAGVFARGGLVFDASVADPPATPANKPITLTRKKTLNKKKQGPFGWSKTVMGDDFRIVGAGFLFRGLIIARNSQAVKENFVLAHRRGRY